MATWGYKLHEDDTFCTIIETYKERLSLGETAPDITHDIRNQYQKSIDYVIVRIAIAECLWRCNKISPEIISEIAKIVETGEDRTYWLSLEADETFLRNRELELKKFLSKINVPPTKQQIWKITSPNRNLEKGTCFWYKRNGQVYGAVVLELQMDYWLIALSKSLPTHPSTPAEVMESPLYTAAWFSPVDMLPGARVHPIGIVEINANYHNKYGLHTEDNRSVNISNCGQSQTWAHTFRAIHFPGRRVGDIINRTD